MENRLLNQYNNVIKSQWVSQEKMEIFDLVSRKALFELAYHTCNTIDSRNILSKDYTKGGFKAILYSSKNKTFTSIEVLGEGLKITMYFDEGSSADRLFNYVLPTLKQRKQKFSAKDDEIKTQLLKTILVERKLDECANLVMLKDINRRVYFAIGDARESAAVVPMFMEAEGASLVQLALNKWMAASQNLVPEENFPESHVPGILKNLMQIKKWVLNLISVNIDG